MKQFGKILKFEWKGYLRNKIFVGLTVFLVISITVVMFLPNIISAFQSDGEEGDSSEDKPMMLIASRDPQLSALIAEYFSEAFVDYTVVISEEGEDRIREQITSEEVQCAFVMENMLSYTYYVNNLSMYDMNPEIANEVLQTVYRLGVMVELGLTPEQAGEVMAIQIDSQTETLGKNQMENFFYTYIMIFALYMVILLYGQMVATSVATEKSSRAMEVLITSADPTSMMFGKVIASCLAGLSQLVLVFGSAILFYNINREQWKDVPIISSIFDMPWQLFVYMLIFFVLGFLIYAFLFGAVGSTASKLEDINTSVMPITVLFIIAFMVVISAMTSGDVDNPMMLVCSYIPFTSPMAMFTRIAMSTVSWYEIAASIAILVVSVVGVGVVAAKIYRVGVLMYGTKPKITDFLKMLKKA